MKLSATGAALIQAFEGLELVAYKCSAGVWTQGWGHTGKDVIPGSKITLEQAQLWFAADVAKFEQGVWNASKGFAKALTQNQFDALVSFAYNLGLGAYQTSSLRKFLALGETVKASAEFLKWDKARVPSKGLTAVAGLTRRRKAEQELFNGA